MKPDEEEETRYDQINVVVVITGNDDTKKGAGRPNAYWAKVREQQDDEEIPQEKPQADTYGGSFRGVRPAPHGGSIAVRPSETLGSDDLCWCGEPAGHMWPGKTAGAPHPLKGTEMNTAAAQKVDRRDLRAYHQRLQDFVLKCINEDGLRFRMTKNSVLLYPTDGSQPMTVFARNTDRQVRQLQKWYLEHVYKEEDYKPADEDTVAKLKELNDPTEHPQREKKKSIETAPQKKAEPPKDDRPPVAPPLEEKADGIIEHPEQTPENAPESLDDWPPYITVDRGSKHPSKEHPLIRQWGNVLRCSSEKCVGTDHEYLRTAMSIGGHMRIYHTDTSKDLYDPETISRRVDSNKHGKLTGEVLQAVEILATAVGVKVGGDPEAEKKISDLTAQRDELQRRVDELEAKQALMREALGL